MATSVLQGVRIPICIPQREHHPAPDPLAWAWYTPTLEDFVALPTAAFAIGKLKQENAVGIAMLYQNASTCYAAWKKTDSNKQDIAVKMVQSLQHTVVLLLQHPLTFHDVVTFVAEAQPMFLDIYAFLDFVKVLMPHLTFPSVSHPV